MRENTLFGRGMGESSIRGVGNLPRGNHSVFPFVSNTGYQGILRILSNFPRGLPGRCPFLGSSLDWQGIVRISSYFFKGVYQVGALSWDHPWTGKVSLESQVTFSRGSTR